MNFVFIFFLQSRNLWKGNIRQGYEIEMPQTSVPFNALSFLGAFSFLVFCGASIF